MKDVKQALYEVGVALPKILLPAKGVDYSKFSVIACDQFSAQPEYWQNVRDRVGENPSALHLMLPEAWLGPKNDVAISEINKTMARYLERRILVDIGETMVYLRRRTTTGVRQGLVLALDLEQYDFSPNSKSMIRATEGTIVDRLPPRIKIRRDAPIEMPHIMVLINDPENLLMQMLQGAQDSFEPLYDFTLMQNGGHLSGWRVDEGKVLMKVAEILAYLKERGGDDLLYAMGDGNHSFATAKACWDAMKNTLSPAERQNHPARYGLVELVNLFDPALKFEPIHRLLIGVDPAKVQQEIGFDAQNPPSLQVLQPLLDAWLQNHPAAELEYIHGEEDCRKLGAAPDRLAIVFPDFDKDSLFDVVRRDGAFARKSFSMGEARDKRYYLECRRIKP